VDVPNPKRANAAPNASQTGPAGSGSSYHSPKLSVSIFDHKTGKVRNKQMVDLLIISALLPFSCPGGTRHKGVKMDANSGGST
jgi:hypothetical protein